MKYLLLLPLIVQALAIFVDEFYFHFAPGQPRWERIGHPLETFTVLAPVLWLMVSTPSERNWIICTLAAVFSCCFVIKDELVHADRCAPGEPVNHAVLIITHPRNRLLGSHSFTFLGFALPAQAAALALYMIYPAVYWNLVWKAPAAQFGARQ
jgi:hypothetical protein